MSLTAHRAHAVTEASREGSPDLKDTPTKLQTSDGLSSDPETAAWFSCAKVLVCKVLKLLEPKPRRAYQRTTNDSRVFPAHELIIEGARTDLVSITDRWPPACFLYGLGFLWWYYKRNGHISAFSLLVCIFIVIAVRESVRTVRWQSHWGKWNMFRTAVQMIGDVLSFFPYFSFVVTSEAPMRIYQNTAVNRQIVAECKSLHKFSATPWLRHSWFAWTVLALEEMYSKVDRWTLFRECISMPDGGTIALDWSVDKQQFDKAQRKRTKEGRDKFQLGKWTLANGHFYESTCFFGHNYADYEEAFTGGHLRLTEEALTGEALRCPPQFSEEQMAEYRDITCLAHDGYVSQSSTPILVIFVTFTGDSLASAPRKVHELFSADGWRVVSLTKRGGASGCSELLPLTTPCSLCFRSEADTGRALHVVSRRYPRAPMVALGLSIGASQGADYVARHCSHAPVAASCPNLRGFVRVDGPYSMLHECESFSRRQWIVSQVLAQFVRDESVAPFWKKNEDMCSQSGLDLEKAQISDCFMHMVATIVAKSNVGHLDGYKYLHNITCIDPETITVPTLVLNSWNDGFMHPYDAPLRFAEFNPNIIHAFTVGGTHVFRREGLTAGRCWISRVSLEFANALLTLDTEKQKPTLA